MNNKRSLGKFLSLVLFLMCSSVYAGWHIPGTNLCVGFGCKGDPIIQLDNPVPELWGESGRVAYPLASGIMMRRGWDADTQSLDEDLKDALEPYFSSYLLDTVHIHWNAGLLDKFGGGEFTIYAGSDGQTFGYNVYLAQKRPDNYDYETVHLLIHELVHVRQYRKHSSSMSDFGYHYFKNFAKAGSYSGNSMEQEAERFADDIVFDVMDKLDVVKNKGLTFCNNTHETLYVALGYYQKAADGFYLVAPEEWFSQGWWRIERNECKKPRAKLTNRYYYFYAKNSNKTTEWKGNNSFCTDHGAFDIKTTSCSSGSHDSKKFRKIDTGKNSYAKTVNLGLSLEKTTNVMFDLIENQYSGTFSGNVETILKYEDDLPTYSRYYPSTNSRILIWKDKNFWYSVNGSEYKKYGSIQDTFDFLLE